MYSMAANADPNLSVKDNLISFAEKSRKELPDDSYASKMYDFVKNNITMVFLGKLLEIMFIKDIKLNKKMAMT